MTRGTSQLLGIGNNGNFGGERNKSVQRDRSLPNDIGSIDFQASSLRPFRFSFSSFSSVSQRGNDLAFISPPGPGIFRYAGPSRCLRLPSVLSSVEPPHRALSIFDKLLDKRDAERDQLSPSSPTHSRQLFAVFDLDIPHPPRKHGNSFDNLSNAVIPLYKPDFTPLPSFPPPRFYFARHRR